MENSGKRKVLRVGLLTAVHNFDPRAQPDFVGAFVLSQVFETPFTSSGGLDTTPLLFGDRLRREDSAQGGFGWSAPVRSGVKFSDGTPLTAADVARSVAAVPAIRERATVEAKGDRVHFELRHRDPRFDLTLTHHCPVWLEREGELVGTGPFCLAKQSTPTSIRLVRNPHFREPVALDEVLFTVYPPDSNGRPERLIAALEAGDVDFTNAPSREEVAGLSKVMKHLLPGLSTAILYFNTERLTDVNVRRALALAIDRMEIAQVSYSNVVAFRANGLLPRAMGSRDDGVPFDLQKARELLARPDVRKPERISLLMTWGPRPHLPNPQGVADVLARQLGELGIRLQRIATENSADYFRRTALAGEDMTLSGWVADTPDPVDFLEVLLSSQAIPEPGGTRIAGNLSRWRSPAADAALERCRAERRDTDLDAVLKLVGDEVPLLPLMYGPTLFVHSFRVRNFEPSPLGIVPLHRIDLRA